MATRAMQSNATLSNATQCGSMNGMNTAEHMLELRASPSMDLELVDDEESSGCEHDEVHDDRATTTAYDGLVVDAMQPILRTAQLDLASRIAERFGMDVKELESMCVDVHRPSVRPRPSASSDKDAGPADDNEPAQAPAAATTAAAIDTGDVNGTIISGVVGEKRKPSLAERTRRNSKRAGKHHSFQIVKKLLDGTDQVLKNLVDVDEANDKIVGRSGTPGSANNELKAALSGADQTLVDLVQNIKHLAGILSAVYPPHVVEKLSSDLGDIADHHPSVSVLMCDIVGFTDWCSHTPPNRVIECLSAYFQILDDLAEKCGIYKVETIGDGYQAICGHDNNTPDHAERMAHFAMSTVELVPLMQRIFKNSDFNIRLGIHSGPIVTGVIRADRPRWQLFGDTVNVAARMESTDEPGRIQISKQTYDLLLMSPNYNVTFTIERRGMMAIKGKGELPTYFLVNLAPQNTKQLEGDITSSLVEQLGMDGLSLMRQPSSMLTSAEGNAVNDAGPRTALNGADGAACSGSGASGSSGNAQSKVKSVLLIDDMLSILLQLTRIMRKAKIKVTTARSGKDALEILYRESFSVVFCDIHMPGLTGLDVVRQFREWEKSNRVYRQRMYALTGDIDKNESYLAAGFDGTVSKNSNKEEILSFVNIHS